MNGTCVKRRIKSVPGTSIRTNIYVSWLVTMSKDKNLCQNRTYHRTIRYVYGIIYNAHRITPLWEPLLRDTFLCQKNGTNVNEQVFMAKHEYLCQARVPMSKDEHICQINGAYVKTHEYLCQGKISFFKEWNHKHFCQAWDMLWCLI